MTHEEWQSLFKLMANQAPPANISPPEPQGYGGPLPDIYASQFGPQIQYNMGLTLPTPMGDARASGSYVSPEQWKMMLGLSKQF